MEKLKRYILCLLFFQVLLSGTNTFQEWVLHQQGHWSIAYGQGVDSCGSGAESFGDADNTDLGTDWNVQFNDNRFGIATGAAVPGDIGNDADEYCNTGSWNADQSCTGVFSTITGSATESGIGCSVRNNTSGSVRSFYACVWNAAISGPDTYIIRRVSGTYGLISDLSGTSASARATLGRVLIATDSGTCTVIGTSITVKVNGISYGAPATDTNLSTGSPGVMYSGSITTAGLASWSAQNEVAVTTIADPIIGAF